MEQQILQVKHLSKSFGKQEVLKDIDFSVSKGEADRVLYVDNIVLSRR